MNKIDEEALDGFTLANRPRVEWIEDFGLTPEETTALEENLAKANASKKVGPPVLGKMSPLPLLTRAAPADTTVPGSGETMTTPSEELLFAARPTVLATDEELVPQYRSRAPPPQGQRFVVPYDFSFGLGRHIWRTSPAEQRQRFIEHEHRKKHPHFVPLFEARRRRSSHWRRSRSQRRWRLSRSHWR